MFSLEGLRPSKTPLFYFPLQKRGEPGYAMEAPPHFDSPLVSPPFDSPFKGGRDLERGFASSAYSDKGLEIYGQPV